MKHLLIIASLCAVPFGASAAVTPAARNTGTPAVAKADMQVAGSYKGKKYCYTRGSATICN